MEPRDRQAPPLHPLIHRQARPHMKLCRFGPLGQEKPGIVDANGAIRDLSGVISELTIETLPQALAADAASLPVAEGTPRYGVPIKGIGKIVAIGLNYRDHAIESNL